MAFGFCKIAAPSTYSARFILATNHSVLIGREDSYVIRPFDGLIDELAIYSRALNASVGDKPAEVIVIELKK